MMTSRILRHHANYVVLFLKSMEILIELYLSCESQDMFVCINNRISLVGRNNTPSKAPVQTQ